MRKKRLLAFLLCLAMAFQLVPFASAEEGFSVYAPDEISIAVGENGTVTVSPENRRLSVDWRESQRSEY